MSGLRMHAVAIGNLLTALMIIDAYTKMFSQMSRLQSILSSSYENAATPIMEPIMAAHLSFERRRRRRDDSSSNNIHNNNKLLTIDVLSIGSKTKLDLLEAQSSTWASHESVRYFWGATEADDSDPTCHLKLNMSTTKQISQHCVRQDWHHSPVMTWMRHSFAQGNYLMGKGPGWLCAQKRPSFAMTKIGKFLREKTTTLPDYLLIVDDDTYANMDMLQSHLLLAGNSSIATADAGCLVRSPIHETTLSFGFGGFGLLLSKGTIQNIIRPIYCNNNDHHNDHFEKVACAQLRRNYFGEQDAFVEGMSISDLMGAHAAMDKYHEFPNWKGKHSFCFHSDWVMGFYINYYHLAMHISDVHNNHGDVFDVGQGVKSFFRKFPETRIGWSLGIIYNKEPPGNCNNEEDRCTLTSVTCHRQTAESMKRLTAAAAAANFEGGSKISKRFSNIGNNSTLPPPPRRPHAHAGAQKRTGK